MVTIFLICLVWLGTFAYRLGHWLYYLPLDRQVRKLVTK